MSLTSNKLTPLKLYVDKDPEKVRLVMKGFYDGLLTVVTKTEATRIFLCDVPTEIPVALYPDALLYHMKEAAIQCLQ